MKLKYRSKLKKFDATLAYVTVASVEGVNI